MADRPPGSHDACLTRARTTESKGGTSSNRRQPIDPLYDQRGVGYRARLGRRARASQQTTAVRFHLGRSFGQPVHFVQYQQLGNYRL